MKKKGNHFVWAKYWETPSPCLHLITCISTKNDKTKYDTEWMTVVALITSSIWRVISTEKIERSHFLNPSILFPSTSSAITMFLFKIPFFHHHQHHQHHAYHTMSPSSTYTQAGLLHARHLGGMRHNTDILTITGECGSVMWCIWCITHNCVWLNHHHQVLSLSPEQDVLVSCSVCELDFSHQVCASEFPPRDSFSWKNQRKRDK